MFGMKQMERWSEEEEERAKIQVPAEGYYWGGMGWDGGWGGGRKGAGGSCPPCSLPPGEYSVTIPNLSYIYNASIRGRILLLYFIIFLFFRDRAESLAIRISMPIHPLLNEHTPP